MSKYRRIGGFQQERSFVRWVLVDSQGEEFVLRTKSLAYTSARAMWEADPEAKLYEETVIRFRSGRTYAGDKRFRIEVPKRRVMLEELGKRC